MKRIFPILFIISILMGCNPSNKNTVPSLPANKVYIVERNGWGPQFKWINDSIHYDESEDYMSILGLIEIDKSFNMKIIKRKGFMYGNYRLGEIPASDSFREMVISTIERFPSDTISKPKYDRIYDGHRYYMLVEKENGQMIYLSGIPDAISLDMKAISSFLRDSALIYANTQIGNQDSIKTYLQGYAKKIENILPKGETFIPPY